MGFTRRVVGLCGRHLEPYIHRELAKQKRSWHDARHGPVRACLSEAAKPTKLNDRSLDKSGHPISAVSVPEDDEGAYSIAPTRGALATAVFKNGLGFSWSPGPEMKGNWQCTGLSQKEDIGSDTEPRLPGQITIRGVP